MPPLHRDATPLFPAQEAQRGHQDVAGREPSRGEEGGRPHLLPGRVDDHRWRQVAGSPRSTSRRVPTPILRAAGPHGGHDHHHQLLPALRPCPRPPGQEGAQPVRQVAQLERAAWRDAHRGACDLLHRVRCGLHGVATTPVLSAYATARGRATRHRGCSHLRVPRRQAALRSATRPTRARRSAWW
jgi:hypothetical protein